MLRLKRVFQNGGQTGAGPRNPQCGAACRPSPAQRRRSDPLGSPLPALVLAAWFAATGQAVAGIITIAKTGDAAPGGGNYLSLQSPLLNNAGQVAFAAQQSSPFPSMAVYRSNGGLVSVIARSGQSAPGGILESAAYPAMNDNGQVAFVGTPVGASPNLYIGNGAITSPVAVNGGPNPAGGLFGGVSSFNLAVNNSGQVAFSANASIPGGPAGTHLFKAGAGGAGALIAADGAPAPGGNIFDSFSYASINDAGQVAFFSRDDPLTFVGLYQGGGGGATTLLARTGDAAPGGGVFTNLWITDPPQNVSGQVAFLGFVSEPAGGSGVYRAQGSVITQIARSGLAAPGGGNFTGFNTPDMNRFGQVAFTGFQSDPFNFSGIYRGDGTALNVLARKGAVEPGGGSFDAFGNPALNSLGTAAFFALSSSGQSGIYLADGQNQIAAARTGDALGGSTISNLYFSGGRYVTGISLGNTGNSTFNVNTGQPMFNDYGQVVFGADLANGKQAIGLYTPDPHFRAATSSAWDLSSNWTLGLAPGKPHDVFIDPSASLTVAGPTIDTTVNSLRVGGGTGAANLLLQGSVLGAANGVTILANGTLSGTGTLNADVTSMGTLSPGSSPGLMTVTGDLTLGPSGTTRIELGGPARGTQYDAFDVGGDLTLNGLLDVLTLGSFVLGAGQSFEIFDVVGALTGVFSGLAEGALVGTFGGRELFITYAYDDGNDVALFTRGAANPPPSPAVPEPATWLLIGSCLAGLAARRRRAV